MEVNARKDEATDYSNKDRGYDDTETMTTNITDNETEWEGEGKDAGGISGRRRRWQVRVWVDLLPQHTACVTLIVCHVFIVIF